MSALSILGDSANRIVLTTLGAARGRPLTAASINERFPASTTPRFVRDRIRFLVRSGLVQPAAPAAGRALDDAPARWVLTSAGDEAVSLLSLMSRIAAHGADIDASTAAVIRERALSDALGAFTDPVAVTALRVLAAHGPLDPSALEAGCDPIPRRTLYRRLDTLVSMGAVVRSTTRRVPRSTEYAMADRWRPTVAIMLLGVWWDIRHPELAGEGSALDLGGLIVAVAPSIRLPPSQGAGRLALDTIDGAGLHRTVLDVTGTAVRVIPDPADAASGIATRTVVRGDTEAWTAAIVNDRRALLEIVGDEALGNAVLTALRTALLSYIR